MAETEKGTSSPINPKQKDSLPDFDLGKNFLSSWKSMSMTDDAMDLDFVSVSKGMKKAFNFNKVNMDFNIDNDYGKLPSFNMDISDLGISSPLKRNAKSQDRSKKELATGNNKGKTDRFSFSFDFNELDDFNFKSSPRKEEIEGTNDEEKEKIGTRDSGNYPVEDNGDNGSHEDVISKMPTSEALITPNLDTQVDAGSDLPTFESSPSKSSQTDNIVLSSKAKIDDVVSTEVVALLEKTISSEKQQPDFIMDKSISPEPVSKESSIAIETRKEASIHSTSSNKSCRDSVMELQDEVSSAATKPIATSDKENGNKFWGGEDSERALGELISIEKENLNQNLPETSKNSLNRYEGPECILAEPIPDKTECLRDHNSLEVSTKPLSSELDQTMPAPVQRTSTAANNTVEKIQREAFTTRSKYFKRPDKPADLSSYASNQTKLYLLTKDVTGSKQQSHLSDESSKSNMKEIQSDGKLNDVSLPKSGEPVSKDHLKMGAQSHNKDLTIEGPDQGMLKSRPVSGGGSKNVRRLESIRLTRETDKFTLKNAVNSENLVPNMSRAQTIRKSIPEGCKSYSSKAVMQMPTLSGKKPSRTSGVKLDLSALMPQKDRSSKDLDSNRVFVDSRQTKTAKIVETKKQTPLNPSLKRKMIEIPNADAVLKPSKRFSEPISNRNSTEVSKNVVDKETCNNETVVDGNNRLILEYSQNSDIDVHWELSMKELEAPFSLENDSNIEKAEACCKELADICNMLRKKHDEAKEILVRAIVNNNKLLMLNHPLYDEKKFASQLTLREVDGQT